MSKKSLIQSIIIDALLFTLKTLPESEESKSHIKSLETVSTALRKPEPKTPRKPQKYEVHHHSGETIHMTMKEISRYIKFSEPSIRVRLSRGNGTFSTTRVINGEETLVTITALREGPRATQP